MPCKPLSDSHSRRLGFMRRRPTRIVCKAVSAFLAYRLARNIRFGQRLVINVCLRSSNLKGDITLYRSIQIGWANSLSEQAVSLIDPLLIQAMSVMLEKLVCFCYPTIAVFQEFLACHGPPVHGWSADFSLVERRLEVVVL